MRRWQFLLQLLLHQVPMANPLCLSFFLGCFAMLPLMACCFSLLWSRFAENRIVLGNASRQFGPSSFVLGHFFFLGVGLGLSIKWVEVAKFFDPTIAPQNPAVRLLRWRGGFWYPWAFIVACQVLSSVSTRVFSPVQGTLLALRYTERALIEFWWLDAPHVQRYDGNLTVGTKWGIQSRRGLIFCVIIICTVWLLTWICFLFCRSTRLWTTLSLGQPGRFGNHP